MKNDVSTTSMLGSGIHLFSIIIDWHPMVKIVFKLKAKIQPSL